MASKACCTIPPVVSDVSQYELKGTYSQSGDLKTYVTGSTESKTGILMIYDIFGLPFPQTLQGADILASAGNLVVLPDFFKGKPMPIEFYPPDNDEKKKALGDFFAGAANPTENVKTIKELMPKIKEQYPNVEKWAVAGFCWGGKVATLSSAEGTPFSASVQVHPAMVDPEDAKKVVIPHMCLATKDEDRKAVDASEEALKNSSIDAVKEKSKVLYWDGTFHGFMAARSNLQDKENLEYYKKGYQEVVNWLKTVL